MSFKEKYCTVDEKAKNDADKILYDLNPELDKITGLPIPFPSFTKIIISNEAYAICEIFEGKLEHLRLSLMK